MSLDFKGPLTSQLQKRNHPFKMSVPIKSFVERFWEKMESCGKKTKSWTTSKMRKPEVITSMASQRKLSIIYMCSKLLLTSVILFAGKYLLPTEEYHNESLYFPVTSLVLGLLCSLSVIKPSRITLLVATIASMSSWLYMCINSVWMFQRVSRFSRHFLQENVKGRDNMDNSLDQIMADSLTWTTKDGKLLFPFMPWTPFVILVELAPLMVIVLTIDMMLTVYCLLVDQKATYTRELPSTMKAISFLFMVAGICAYAENTLDINLDLGKSRPTGFEVQQYWLFAVGYLQLPMPGLLMIDTGILPLVVSSFYLFLSKDYLTYMAKRYDEEQEFNEWLQPCFKDNGTELCLKWCQMEEFEYVSPWNLDGICMDFCIPQKKRCDSVLDFLYGPENFTSWSTFPARKGTGSDIVIVSVKNVNGSELSMSPEEYFSRYQVLHCVKHGLLDYYWMSLSSPDQAFALTVADESFCQTQNNFSSIFKFITNAGLGFGAVMAIVTLIINCIYFVLLIFMTRCFTRKILQAKSEIGQRMVDKLTKPQQMKFRIRKELNQVDNMETINQFLAAGTNQNRIKNPVDKATMI